MVRPRRSRRARCRGPVGRLCRRDVEHPVELRPRMENALSTPTASRPTTSARGSIGWCGDRRRVRELAASSPDVYLSSRLGVGCLCAHAGPPTSSTAHASAYVVERIGKALPSSLGQHRSEPTTVTGPSPRDGLPFPDGVEQEDPLLLVSGDARWLVVVVCALISNVSNRRYSCSSYAPSTRIVGPETSVAVLHQRPVLDHERDRAPFRPRTVLHVCHGVPPYSLARCVSRMPPPADARSLASASAPPSLRRRTPLPRVRRGVRLPCPTGGCERDHDPGADRSVDHVPRLRAADPRGRTRIPAVPRARLARLLLRRSLLTSLAPCETGMPRLAALRSLASSSASRPLAPSPRVG